MIASMMVVCPLASVSADTVPLAPVIITELQTGNDTAGQEFIELYNQSDEEIDFADTDGAAKRTWKIQYFSGTKVATPGFAWDTTAPSGTISLTGKIAPHEYYLLATTGYLPGSTDPDQTFSPHFSNDAGGLRLVSVTTADKLIVGYDHLGWRKMADGEVLPSDFVDPHSLHASWQRKLNSDERYTDDTGVLVALLDTADISPKAAWQPSETVPVSDPPVDPAPDTPPEDPQPPVADPPTTDEPQLPVDDTAVLPFLPVRITELLPNPAAPASDDTDEFVELFNPNGTPVDVSGYKIETGLNNTYHFVLETMIIPAYGYVTVTSGASNLSLANSGGHARLLDPQGAVVSASDDYADAPSGESWALFDASWQWTHTPTPLLGNILTIPAVPAPKPVATKAVKKPVVKTASTKKATAKPAVKAASTTKKSPAVKAATTSQASAAPASEASVPPIHTGILAAAGLLAVGYAGYEYRRDIANRLYQFRRYRADRKAARASASGR